MGVNIWRTEGDQCKVGSRVMSKNKSKVKGYICIKMLLLNVWYSNFKIGKIVYVTVY